MFKKTAFTMLMLGFIWVSTPATAAVEIGEAAPKFAATDINGNVFNLADQAGKTVVLEWTNHDCPFVVKHYSTGNMQATQKTATDNGVVWVSIVSSADGKQGNVTAEEAQKIVEEKGAHATARILDTSGEIGKLYGAKTTPHMFVISAEGNTVYAGAIDDNPSPSPRAVEGAKNFVLSALDNIAADVPVEVSNTVPYGCSVKY